MSDEKRPTKADAGPREQLARGEPVTDATDDTEGHMPWRYSPEPVAPGPEDADRDGGSPDTSDDSEGHGASADGTAADDVARGKPVTEPMDDTEGHRRKPGPGEAIVDDDVSGLGPDEGVRIKF